MLSISNKLFKAELFNSLFAKQCSIIDNGTEITSFLHPKTDKSLSNITFTEKDIEKVIQNLDSNKAHRHNMISIHMLKMCSESIIKSLQIICRKCLEKVCFPDDWKKANLILVHEKMTINH